MPVYTVKKLAWMHIWLIDLIEINSQSLTSYVSTFRVSLLAGCQANKRKWLQVTKSRIRNITKFCTWWPGDTRSQGINSWRQPLRSPGLVYLASTGMILWYSFPVHVRYTCQPVPEPSRYHWLSARCWWHRADTGLVLAQDWKCSECAQSSAPPECHEFTWGDYTLINKPPTSWQNNKTWIMITILLNPE